MLFGCGYAAPQENPCAQSLMTLHIGKGLAIDIPLKSSWMRKSEWLVHEPVAEATVTRQLRSGMDFTLGIDDLTDDAYYEMQNYFESRVAPLARAFRSSGSGIHPGHGKTIMIRPEWKA